jgi:hypothetical protein
LWLFHNVYISEYHDVHLKYTQLLSIISQCSWKIGKYYRQLEERVIFVRFDPTLLWTFSLFWIWLFCLFFNICVTPFLTLYVKTFSRLIVGVGEMSQFSMLTPSTTKQNRVCGTAQCRSLGPVLVLAHLPSWTLSSLSLGWFPGSTYIVRLNPVHSSIWGGHITLWDFTWHSASS